MVSKNNQYWTLGEAAVWIITRNEGKVLRIPESSRGMFKEAIKVLPDYDDEFYTEYNTAVQTAVKKIKEGCKDGSIRSYGQKNNQSRIEIIPALDWSTPQSKLMPKETDCLYNGQNCSWINLSFSKDDLVTNFTGNRAGKRGRKPKFNEDIKYFEKMHELIISGKAKSYTEAAQMVANPNQENSGEKWTIEGRIRRDYSKWLKINDN